MLVAGTMMLGRRYHVLGQGLMGGGLAALYGAVFASANLYHLITPEVAFGLMCGVTALAAAISVRFNSILCMVLAIIGGYGMPVLLSTGVVNFKALFTYELILGVGVLAICYWKNWPIVNYLSFAATYALYYGAMQKYETTMFWQVMPFLVGFFVLFSTMTFLYKIINQTRSNLLDLLALLINAGVFFYESNRLVGEVYGQKWVAAVSLSLAVFYCLHVFYFLWRKIVDRDLLFCFISLAAFFLAITMPLLLSHEWITVSWAIQAFVLLWVAGKLGSDFVRHVAYVLYGIVLIRFGAIDLPNQFLQGPASADVPLKDYLRLLAERVVMFGVPIASIGAAYRLLSRQPVIEDAAVTSANDLRNGFSGAWMMRLAVGFALIMMFVYLNLEFERTFGYVYSPAKLPLMTLLWLAMAGLLLYEVVVRGSRALMVVMGIFVAALLAKLVIFDLPSWALDQRTMIYHGTYSFRDAGLRLLDFGAVAGFFAAAYALMISRTNVRNAGVAFGFAGLATLFVYLTLEVNSFLFTYLDGMRAGGVSILWSLFALTLLIRGIVKNARALRYIGLALFAIVAWKVFFVDLEKLDQLYRIIAFVLLGILVLCGSFVYLRFRESFSTETPSGTESPA
jgi:uncharacterized membrane protein